VPCGAGLAPATVSKGVVSVSTVHGWVAIVLLQGRNTLSKALLGRQAARARACWHEASCLNPSWSAEDPESQECYALALEASHP